MNHKDLGAFGERQAALHLERGGYEIVARGYKNTCAEIDIIARKRNVLIFVEVKTRTSVKYGMPCEAVGADKQRRLLRAGALYLSLHCPAEQACRFDVIEVFVKDGVVERVRQIENAFGS